MQNIYRWVGLHDSRRRSLVQCLFSVAAVLLFYVVLLRKGPVNDWLSMEEAHRPIMLLLFALLVLGTIVYLAITRRWAWPTFLFISMLVAIAVYMRMAVMDVATGDYNTFLSQWVHVFREQGFSAITENIGDYNLPYMYILAGIANLPLKDLYLIKFVSIISEFLLALLMMNFVGRFLNKRLEMPTLAVMLLLPTLFFNGAYWAQCDALYVFFVIACLYAMLADRPVLSVAMLTIAFGFKLQTIFFFPIALFGLFFKKYKLRHALVFPLVYLLLMLPALLMGRSLMSTLTIYLNQASQYNHRLTYNAPNIYQFFPDVEVGYSNEWNVLKYIPGVDKFSFDWHYTIEMMRRISQATVPFAGILVVALLYYFYMHRKYVRLEHVYSFTLLFALLMPLVLPKMHERYFMIAEMLSLLYGLRYRKRFYVPVLVIGASFFSYYPFLFRFRQIDMRITALMMIGGFLIVLWDLIRGMQKAKREDPAVKREEIELEYTL